ncbi:hypothetical protein D9611_006376 [Ephemerocybe angulata]|uniref:F-box domain-containing protein n=1 Tax=Ephemerocybe angulata TaxID=980116 RepID=A0A8H5C6G4_9AGAR|nr:hypothetical protein D9611_006376 [Tulosesus angulatus]
MVHDSILPADLTARIPQEIFDHIIVAAPSKPTLESFSLVCNSWASTSRTRLFETVKLSKKFIHRMDEDAGASRHILPCVRNAHIFRMHASERPGSERCRDRLRILSKMTGLRAMTLKECSASFVRLLGESLERGNNSDTISTLVLEGTVDFPSFTEFQETIAMFSGLRHLSLWTVDPGVAPADKHVGPTTSSVSPTIPVPPKLRSVTFMFSNSLHQMISWFFGPTKFLEIPLLDLAEIGVLAQTKHTRIERLSLGLFCDPPPRSLEKLLSGWDCLNTIDPGPIYLSSPLGTHCSYNDLSGDQSLPVTPWYSQMLSSITSCLSRLNFKLVGTEEPDGGVHRMDWATLDSLLDTSPFYRNLEVLQIGIVDFPITLADVERSVRPRLPGLRSSTRLEVVWISGEYVISD